VPEETALPRPELFAKVSTGLEHLQTGIRSLEEWYAADFKRRIAELTELLQSQIAEEMRSQFTAELNTQVDRMRVQFEERLYTQSTQADLKQRSLLQEIQELRKRIPSNNLFQEIAYTEAAILKAAEACDLEIERSVPDAAALARLMRAKTEQLELKAYLKGLKYQVGPGDPRLSKEPAAPASNETVFDS